MCRSLLLVNCFRVDVSGFTPTQGNAGDCFVDGNGGVTGNLCLSDLFAANPGIGRPNIRFKLVGENSCTAAVRYCFSASPNLSTSGPCNTSNVWVNRYKGELRLTGIQVAAFNPNNPPATKTLFSGATMLGRSTETSPISWSEMRLTS